MNRREFLTGALAAPVVITTPGLLMPVRKLTPWYPITLHFTIETNPLLEGITWVEAQFQRHTQIPNTLIVGKPDAQCPVSQRLSRVWDQEGRHVLYSQIEAATWRYRATVAHPIQTEPVDEQPV